MKKKRLAITVLLLALLLCACHAPKEAPSQEEIPSTPYQNVYDDGGNLLVEYLTDENGAYNGKIEYLSEDGLMKKRVYDKEDKLTEETGEAYDAQGKLIRQLKYDGINNRKKERVYTYDTEGKRTQITDTTEFFETGIGYRCVTKYNEKGQPLRYSDYNLEGTLLYYMEFEYEGDRRVKTTVVNRSPREYYYWICAYNEEGHCVSATYYNSDDEVTEVRTYIWEDGNHVKTVSSKGHYTLYYYDENGTELGHETYDSEGQLTGIYDAMYNPIDTPFR